MIAASELIPQMMDAAVKAAHIALLRRKEGVMRGRKPDGSWITNGDFQAQQVIEIELQKIIAAHAELAGCKFLMEEQMGGAEPDFVGRKKGYHMTVDPVDGTIGYSRDIGEEAAPWTISISLEKDGQSIAAVAYEAAKHEYGNTQADRDAITPNAPKGAIFWAAEDKAATHKVTGELTVQPHAGASYEQINIDPANPGSFKKLKDVPQLDVTYGRITDRVIETDTPIAPQALTRVDRMKYDWKGDDALSPYTAQFMEDCGLNNSNSARNTTCVGAAMGVIQGTVRGFISSGGYPWDNSGIQLLMKKAGVLHEEYGAGPEEKGQRTLIASRDPELFARMKKAVFELRNGRNMPVVHRLDEVRATAVDPGAVNRNWRPGI